MDAGGGQVTKDSKAADMAGIDFARVNPVTGPIYIEGAKPGDVLKVSFDSFRPNGFGWTANIPGFGLLADQFPDPALKLWSYDPSVDGRQRNDPKIPLARIDDAGVITAATATVKV